MKLLLAALAAALLFTVAVPANAGPPFEAVRAITSAVSGNICSAVVVEPGVALTAAHCLQRGLSIDGFAVYSITAFGDSKDIARLNVPGLSCPCAATGSRPAVGDQVLAAGFPLAAEGARVVSPVARVAFIGNVRQYIPDFPGELSNETYIITDAAIIDHGDSGGALFSLRDGEWRVVGINAIGVPDVSSCMPFVGCAKEIGSGFVPADLVEKL